MAQMTYGINERQRRRRRKLCKFFGWVDLLSQNLLRVLYIHVQFLSIAFNFGSDDDAVRMDMKCLLSKQDEDDNDKHIHTAVCFIV